MKGLEETQRLTEEFQAAGFEPVPHISARMVRDRAHCAELAHWLRDNGLKKMFLVGGDQDPPGEYFELRDGKFFPRQRMRLFMATTRPDIAASDCLFYFVPDSATS